LTESTRDPERQPRPRQFSLRHWDAEVTDISPETFIFGVQGPASLFTLEKAAGESLRDTALPFKPDRRRTDVTKL
jgi:hypothetical protein